MKERIISAVIALLITVPLVLLGGVYFDILVIVLGLLGVREMINAKGNIPNLMRYISYVLFVILIVNNFELVGTTFSINIELVILSIISLFLPLIMYHDDKKYNIIDALYLFATVIFLSIAFNLFVIVRDNGIMLTLYLFLITITTDTFAYIGGSKFGKNKLAPTISPKKSVEGFFIGLFFGTIIPVLVYYFCINSSINILILILITALLSVIGQFGDLIFSSIKRHFGVKDFSNLMPGHGGVLDRLDSIIFVLYAYMILSSLI